ncbi:hypothetical protein [Dokdonia sp.]
MRLFEGVTAIYTFGELSAYRKAVLEASKASAKSESSTGISAIIAMLKTNSLKNRADEIVVNFVDETGSGVYSLLEAEGAAIIEDAFQTTLRAVKKTDPKSGDFIFTTGRYKNKSIDMISAPNHSGFNIDSFIKSIDSHFRDKGATTDFFNIDMRALDNAGKKRVQDHVSKMSKSNQEKVIYTQ